MCGACGMIDGWVSRSGRESCLMGGEEGCCCGGGIGGWTESRIRNRGRASSRKQSWRKIG